MIEAKVTGSGLQVEVTGGDSLPFMLRPRLSVVVPLEQVRGAEVGPAVTTGRRHVNVVASERRHDKGFFVCARFRAPTVRIDLEGGPYRRMILSVPDPESTASQIQSAIAGR